MRKFTIVLSILILSSCGGNSNNPLVPDGTNPQVDNSPDNFEFTAIDFANVSNLYDYTWSNSGTQATITHASSVDSGTALLYLYDGNGNLVYSNGLAASAVQQSQVGAAGNWLVRLSLNNCWGDLNFRVEKL